MFFPGSHVPGLSVDNGGSHVLRWMWCPGRGRPRLLQSLRQTIRRASDRSTVKHRPRATACSSVGNSLAGLLCLECDWRRGFVYHREHARRARRRDGSSGASLGPEPWHSSSPSSRCSIFLSEPRWASTPCGFFFPARRNRNTRRWWPLALRKVLESIFPAIIHFVDPFDEKRRLRPMIPPRPW